MKKLFLLFYLSVNIFALEKLNLSDPGLSENSKVLLESISDHAIKIGQGSTCKTYVFVDPMCPHSRNFIKKIIKNKEAQELNTYYVYLYKLPKFDSNKLSLYIYQSSNSLDTLQEVMVQEKEIDLNTTSIANDKENILQAISTIGAKLHIKIRPYIMEFEKGSKYCRVSIGDAPCLEENDF